MAKIGTGSGTVAEIVMGSDPIAKIGIASKKKEGLFMSSNYKCAQLSPKERTDDLLSRMTLEEKVGQMMQISFSCVSPEEAEEWVTKRFAGSYLHTLGDDAKHLQELALTTRLGIPLLFGIDAIHGHGLHNGATIFPSQLAMSCSWNTELIERAGRVTAKEVAADGLHWTFSPVLCIGRDLRWGRIDETFGEDPYLIGKLASAIIKGYQGEDLSNDDSILACAKHYLAYGESTGGRDSYDTEITYRKVRETFLPPFKKAAEAGCATFMAGYQSIDGVPVSANKKLLREILKEEIKFNGYVVTDWNNTGNLANMQWVSKDIDEASKTVVEAGNDMIMNTPEFYDSVVKLVKEGAISEKLIDDAVRRILYIKFAMGLFDNKKNINTKERAKIFACKEHLDADLELTRESIVLLENKNNTLPLRDKVKSIAVIGPNADDIQSQYGDWTFFTHSIPNPDAVPSKPYYTMLQGIKKLAEENNIEVKYHKGCHIMNYEEDIPGALRTAENSDVIIAVVGDCVIQNGESHDRANLDLSGAQLKLLKELKALRKPLIVVLVNGKPLSIPWISENADAVVETFNSGMLGGLALSEILFGKVNPCGKLSISFPYHVGQLPVYYNQMPGWHLEGKYIDMPKEPLYSFGYGLSYTNYEYSNLRLSQDACSKDQKTVSALVDVKNTGKVDGKEIVQLYVRDKVSTVVTSIKQLKGFEKVNIKAGEKKTVELLLNIEELAVVLPDESYVVEPGEFTIMVGPDSRETSLLKTILKII